MTTPAIVFAAGFAIITIALILIAFSDRRSAVRYPFGRPGRTKWDRTRGFLE